MKLFHTGSADVVNECFRYFDFLPLSYQIDIRTVKFFDQFMLSDNIVCQLFHDRAACDLNKVYLSYGCDINSLSELLVLMHKFFD